MTYLVVNSCLALEHLNCHSNKITNLVVDELTKLKTLICYNNSIVAIDVTNSMDLETLNCYGNQIDSLDVSNHKKLTLLRWVPCKYTFTSLNASGCTALTEYNETATAGTQTIRLISSIDFSGCTALTKFYFKASTINTLIESINLSGCIALTRVDCLGNSTSNTYNYKCYVGTLNMSGCIGFLDNNGNLPMSANMLYLNLSGCAGITKIQYYYSIIRADDVYV
nr:hypothetical protein [Synergistaceae bacterium]